MAREPEAQSEQHAEHFQDEDVLAAKTKRHTAGWWAISIILHVGAFTALIFPSVRAALFTDTEPEDLTKNISAEQYRESAEQLRVIAKRRMAHQIKQLRDILKEMRTFRQETLDRVLENKAELRAGLKKITWTPKPGGINARKATVMDMYTNAAETETSIVGTYSDFRTIELAKLQDVTLQSARETASIAPPDRPTFDADVILGEVNSREQFIAFRDELTELRAEVNAMVIASKRILDLVQDITAEVPQYSVRWEGSGTMYQGTGGADWGSPVGPALLASEFFPGGKPSDLDSRWFKPVPGRRITGDADRAKWMFIDTWHIIGPFPNPGRANLDKKFPPETTIDLDAKYVGKHADFKLTWQYHRTGDVMVAPPIVDKYAIWYAFTEVYSDRERELWVAFGSDDYGKAWVNGKVVWTSGKTPHHWIPDRGYRKVKFHKGNNQILVKWENAGGTTGMSMVLFLESAEGEGDE